MSALAIVISAVSVAFVIAFVAALRWCDRRDELDAQRRAREGGDLGLAAGRQRAALQARIDGQVTRDFWAGASPPSPWPVDPHAPGEPFSEKAMREKMGDAWVDEKLIWHREWGVERDWTYLHNPEHRE